MRQKIKSDSIVLYCGIALVVNSVFILILFIIGVSQNVFPKMSYINSVELPLIIGFGGITMAFIGTWLINKNMPLHTSGSE